MADPVADYPYETGLNILYLPLEVIDVNALADLDDLESAQSQKRAS
jgi:hypothetical protein